jgi:transcription-repair coupling factor (superfamily II helicase)
MNLSGLLGPLQSSSEFQSLLARLSEPSATTALNILGAARPYLLAALQDNWRRPLLVVAPKPEQALQLFRQLSTWAAEPADVLHFPESDSLPYERAPTSLDVRQRRLKVVERLAASANAGDGGPDTLHHWGSPLIVTSARALMQQTISPAQYQKASMLIRRDESHPLGPLMTHWQQIGYEPVTIVDQPGQFSHRGGIVDIWPPAMDMPARIEFFGDEIDSMRLFDPVSQRSRDPLSEIRVIPGSEALPILGPDGARRLRRVRGLADELSDGARRDLDDDLETMSQGRRSSVQEVYLHYLDTPAVSLLSHLPPGALLVADDLQAVAAAGREWESEIDQLRANAVESREIPAGFIAPVVLLKFEGSETAEGAPAHPLVQLRPHLNLTFGLYDQAIGRWQELFASAPRYGGKMLQAIDDWRARLNAGERLIVVSRQADRLAELMHERNLPVELRENVAGEPFTLVTGALAEGFEFSEPAHGSALLENLSGGSNAPHAAPPPPLIVFSDAEIFGYARPEPRRSSEKRAAPMEAYYADLAPGDYVVHIEHGIARYAGLVRRDFHAVEREYLQLEYAGGDKLFVPVEQADRVARYVGSGEHAPAVHRLGTTYWESAKARAQRAVADIADDLMKLYAQRAQVPGHAFSADTAWQQELENSFPYAETPDQLRALEAVKRDMESARPMDRLICGDVGYGKTEVALRAAFKAAMDGTQVGVLVPTTVLAEQHWKTFCERLKAFPIEVEMISRFRTESQQKKILERLQKGGVDILIGTHRLLQPDVQFKNLGLLVIDEEQRFGVKAKEKLKQLRTEVDVLTLTATPIPRTLNMALMGARDMSTIDTPPDERLPIRTYVIQYDEAIVKQAIMRELGRNGQVFFVHNRVLGIEQVVARLRRLVPEARIAVGHGQMPERELERVMLDFSEARYDVLVCTSIIESGIDLPNVNTIIINRADQFGLADLYQLRGRVGRSARQSYAYLMYSRDKVLVDIARKRLQAIFEASELGAGFKIAMRDLEIRGAGDILGAKQHGQITAIGFDLYTKLLAQAVREKREQLPAQQQTAPRRAVPERDSEMPQTTDSIGIDLPLETHIPADYVPEEALRLRLYRRMAEMNDPEIVREFEGELADRFGMLPTPVTNLLYMLRVKTLAARAGVDAVLAQNDNILVRFRERVTLLEWRPSRELERAVTVSRNSVTLPFGTNHAWMAPLEKLLSEIGQKSR